MMTPEEELQVREFLTKRVSEMHLACDNYEAEVQRLQAELAEAQQPARRAAGFEIPKRFKMLGQTIEVVFDPELVNNDDWTGAAIYRRNLIKVMPDCEAHPRTEAQIQHTFMHELTHFALYYSGPARHADNDLHRDEGFVGMTAGLLHQALTTMEYE